MPDDTRRSMRSVTQVRVRFAETDAAGIVHYAQYLNYLDAGRAAALRSTGLSSDWVAQCSIHARLLQAAIQYRSAAHFDEVLDVYTWLSDWVAVEFRFAYEIRRAADQVLVASAKTLHGWLDPTIPTGAPPPVWLRNALEQLRG